MKDLLVLLMNHEISFTFGIMMFKTGGLLRKTAVVINYLLNLAFDLSQ